MGNYVGIDCLAGSVKRHALPEDQFVTSVCLVKSLIAQGQFDNAIKSCLDLLKGLGAPMPKKPTTAAILYDLFKTMRIVRNKSDDFLTNLPELEDSHILCVVKVMNVFGSTEYLSGSN